jgi:hypothetical protein
MPPQVDSRQFDDNDSVTGSGRRMGAGTITLPAISHPHVLRAIVTATCQDGPMGRVARILVVGLSALILGVVMLAMALWLLVLVDPHTVLQSCSASSSSTGAGAQECTPLSTGGAWPWLPALSGLLGGVAGGFGVDRLIRCRRTPSDQMPPPRPAFR